MTPAELIEKLERADGPSRELDAALKANFYGGVPMLSPFNGNWCVYRDGASDPRKDRVMERPRHVPHEVWANDRYTASIDAAMTLVPEGWSYTVAWLHRNGRATVAMFHAKLNEQRAESHTPALALCIAALKAKEADNG